MFQKTHYYCFVILMTLLLSFFSLRCSNDGYDENEKIGKIDISGARELIIFSGKTVIGNNISSIKLADSNEDSFVKLKADGMVQYVNIFNVDGHPLKGKIPQQFFNATNTYMIIVIDNNPYLVDRTDGAAYDLSPVGLPTTIDHNSGFNGPTRKSIYNDFAGNIYYLSDGIVKKIDVSNPEYITAQNYTPGTDRIEEFAVDTYGNVIYLAFGAKRIKKTNGGLYNLPLNAYAFWIGNDGLIHDIENNLKKITIDPSFKVIIEDHPNNGYPTTYQGYQHTWLYLQNRIIAVCQFIFELENPADKPRFIHLEALTYDNIKFVNSSNSYYYIATGHGSIIKVNPVDDSCAILIAKNEYDYYSMDVSNEDIVFFNALRMSDGKKVMGTISATGIVSIIDDNFSDEVVVLHKVF